MNLLIVGRGPGSWTMRGVQLGAALGARVTSEPTDADWHWAERVVLVKRAGAIWAARAHALGLPIVWDALDFWRQPFDNFLAEASARRLLAQALDVIRPARTIGATAAMAAAAGGVYLPHHGWAGLTPTPARPQIQTVGYDGNPIYLDAWRPVLERVCAARGWTLVISPPDLSTVDVLVALRGGPWDGWMPREWKSGVKLVNAILAGRPIVTQDTAAMRGLQPQGTVIATLLDLPAALDSWQDPDRRQAVVEASRLRVAAFSVDAIAAQYRTHILGVAARAEGAA
jgi:hypothetical protein